MRNGDACVSCRDLSVPKKEIVLPVAALLVVVVALFDIDVNLTLTMSRDTQQLDTEQEARFDTCVDENDRLVHAETFGNVDNPDVQREMLMTGKEQIVRDCRQKYPDIQVTVREPFRFNLVDVKFRY